MPLTMTNITGPVYLPDGATPLGGRVSFELSSWDVEDTAGLVVTGPVYVPIDEQGQFNVQLFTTTAGTESVTYRMFVIWEDSTLAQSYVNDIYVSHPTPHYTKKFIGSFVLSGPGPYQLSELDIVSEVNNSSFDAYLEMKAFADRIDLGVLDTAVLEAGTYRDQSEAARDIAAQSATDAATSETNAENFANAASTSAINAAKYSAFTRDNVSMLLADTALTYITEQSGTVTADDIIRTRAEGFSYKVAASDATDHDITTAGGVKLYIIMGNSGVSPEQFGYTGGDVFPYLADTLAKGNVFLSGPMELSSDVVVEVPDLYIKAVNGADILFTGTLGNRMIEITGNRNLILNGSLSMRGDNKTACGLFVRAVDTAPLVVLSGLKTSGMRRLAGASYGAAGVIMIAVTGSGAIARLSECEVDSVTRDTVDGTCAGITLTDYKVMEVKNCKIRNVLKGSGTGDADGIKVFSQNDGTNYERAVIRVENNQIENCEGRFVKIQSKGTCVIDGNDFRITDTIDLITAFRGIDSQIGSTTVCNNIFDLGAVWTGGSEAEPILLQVPNYAPTYAGEPIHFGVYNNKVSKLAAAPVMSRFVRFYTANLTNRAYAVSASVTDNWMHTETGYGGGEAAVIAATFDPPVTFAAGARFDVDFSDNWMDTRTFLEGLTASGGTAAHGGLGDLTQVMSMKITGNRNPRTGFVPLMSYTDNQCFTSNIFIANNAVGNQANAWWPPFDYAWIQGGEFYIPNIPVPARIGPPPNEQYSIVQRQSGYLEARYGGANKANQYISISSWGVGTTWT